MGHQLSKRTRVEPAETEAQEAQETQAQFSAAQAQAVSLGAEREQLHKQIKAAAAKGFWDVRVDKATALKFRAELEAQGYELRPYAGVLYEISWSKDLLK